MYNILLKLSRNILFYKKIKLQDSFETRIYLMFIHFSIIMIIYKKKGKKFNQSSYDLLFHNIENNLRELGFGDVSVNKKMKDMNKILYDILLKIEESNKKNEDFNINHKLVIKYFSKLKDPKSNEYLEFRSYFLKFFNFCFDKPVKNMLEEVSKFEI
jgi:cytochrome b pre-mRNA-processing protein 3|tara:strand:- start:327 stop:797 length:471 start_codon:yes stop_codon:yes gene_type:complete